jgi:hypothetical protein
MGRVILKPMRLRRRDFIRGSAAGTVTLAARHGFSFAKRHYDDALLDTLLTARSNTFGMQATPRVGSAEI